MNNTYIKVLVVDNSPTYTRKIAQQLKSDSLKQPAFPQYNIKTATTGLDGLLISQDFRPDCVLVSFALADMDRFEFLESLAGIRGGLAVPALLMLEPGTDDSVVSLSKLDGYEHFVKGEFDELQLMWAIFCVLEQSKLEKQLYRKHQELKMFADRMAHDLLTSLSKLSICAEYLEMEDEASRGGAIDRTELLSTMVKSVDQTIGLVESFRNYAHVDRMNVAFANVNLNSLMDHILLSMETEIAESGAEIYVEPLPVVFGDLLGIGQLLHTLVENAVNYSNQAPLIHIQTTKFDTTWQISILVSTNNDSRLVRPVNSDLDVGGTVDSKSDGNVGGLHFGKAAHRTIPIPERAQSGNQQYPGTAIELATCRRIVEQHGGELHFCSTSTDEIAFFFTIAQDLKTTSGYAGNNPFEDIALSNHQYSTAVAVQKESLNIYHSTR